MHPGHGEGFSRHTRCVARIACALLALLAASLVPSAPALAGQLADVTSATAGQLAATAASAGGTLRSPAAAAGSGREETVGAAAATVAGAPAPPVSLAGAPAAPPAPAAASTAPSVASLTRHVTEVAAAPAGAPAAVSGGGGLPPPRPAQPAAIVHPSGATQAVQLVRAAASTVPAAAGAVTRVASGALNATQTTLGAVTRVASGALNATQTTLGAVTRVASGALNATQTTVASALAAAAAPSGRLSGGGAPNALEIVRTAPGALSQALGSLASSMLSGSGTRAIGSSRGTLPALAQTVLVPARGVASARPGPIGPAGVLAPLHAGDIRTGAAVAVSRRLGGMRPSAQTRDVTATLAAAAVFAAPGPQAPTDDDAAARTRTTAYSETLGGGGRSPVSVGYSPSAGGAFTPLPALALIALAHLGAGAPAALGRICPQRSRGPRAPVSLIPARPD
jgi:DNA polymerase III subunit gamma/tau